MKIEIKNVKYAAFASEETHCFSATLYVDGKRLCIVKNDGHGGCDDYHPLNMNKSNPMKGRALWDRIAEINKELNKEKIPSKYFPDGMPNDLELVVGNLMNEWHQKNEVKSILRRISYIRDGKVYQMPAKYKPTDDMIRQVQASTFWRSENILLNVGGKNQVENAWSRLDQINYFGE